MVLFSNFGGMGEDMVSLSGYVTFILLLVGYRITKENPPTCGKTTVGRLFEVYRPCRCTVFKTCIINLVLAMNSSVFLKNK